MLLKAPLPPNHWNAWVLIKTFSMKLAATISSKGKMKRSVIKWHFYTVFPVLYNAVNYLKIFVPSKNDLYPQKLNPRGTCTPKSKCEWECRHIQILGQVFIFVSFQQVNMLKAAYRGSCTTTCIVMEKISIWIPLLSRALEIATVSKQCDDI